MKFSFSKYHGTGNDFVILDGRAVQGHLSGEEIARICHRHFGIGADGLILVNPSLNAGVDYEMIYHNADGFVGSMCGNGARCAFAFARSRELAWNEANFLAYDGMHQARIKDGAVRVSLRDVTAISAMDEDTYFLDTGSPHVVRFVNNIEAVNVFHEGRELRHHADFSPKGTNVNFVEIQNARLRVRTFERGVEDITMSCGTGVTASALAFAVKNDITKGSIAVDADGGQLSVDFEKSGSSFTQIWLQGPVQHVFDGIYESR
jgi:diaminopimelate epimerase